MQLKIAAMLPKLKVLPRRRGVALCARREGLWAAPGTGGKAQEDGPSAAGCHEQ